MRKRIIFFILSLIIISSFGAGALDKETLQKQKFTGWNVDSETQDTTYYKDGVMVKNKWVNLKDNIYYFKDNGTMAKGWMQLNNKWYYFITNGQMINNMWYAVNDKSYYFNTDGSMAIGWQQIEGKWYYLNADGTKAHDTYVGGYRVGSDGAWIK